MILNDKNNFIFLLNEKFLQKEIKNLIIEKIILEKKLLLEGESILVNFLGKKAKNIAKFFIDFAKIGVKTVGLYGSAAISLHAIITGESPKIYKRRLRMLNGAQDYIVNSIKTKTDWLKSDPTMGKKIAEVFGNSLILGLPMTSEGIEGIKEVIDTYKKKRTEDSYLGIMTELFGNRELTYVVDELVRNLMDDALSNWKDFCRKDRNKESFEKDLRALNAGTKKHNEVAQELSKKLTKSGNKIEIKAVQLIQSIFNNHQALSSETKNMLATFIFRSITQNCVGSQISHEEINNVKPEIENIGISGFSYKIGSTFATNNLDIKLSSSFSSDDLQQFLSTFFNNQTIIWKKVNYSKDGRGVVEIPSGKFDDFIEEVKTQLKEYLTSMMDPQQNLNEEQKAILNIYDNVFNYLKDKIDDNKLDSRVRELSSFESYRDIREKFIEKVKKIMTEIKKKSDESTSSEQIEVSGESKLLQKIDFCSRLLEIEKIVAKICPESSKGRY